MSDKPTEQELRELDVFCAEKVMGWRLVNYETGKEADCSTDYTIAYRNDGWTWDGEEEAYKWQPTKNGKQSLEVLKKCAEIVGVEIKKTHMINIGEVFMVSTEFSHEQTISAFAQTLELAICLFARKLHEK